MAAVEPQNSIPYIRRHVVEGWLQAASSRFHWFRDVYPENLHNMDPGTARSLTIEAIDDGTNDFVVTLVAASGFFTDSYILFATNAILPMLDYVYWGSSTDPKFETAINCATLAGCVLGMVSFGFLGDKFGRRKLYGIELLTLIAGTLGLVMSSPGYIPVDQLSGKSAFQIDWTKVGSMNVVAWLVFWRIVSGVGIGGDYPLSAAMVSEMAPRKKRARMLAIVFSMQAFGCFAATITSIVVVSIVRSHHPTPSPIYVDQIWRWVMGFSLIFASIAVVMRCFVPESPRFTIDVLNYPYRALQEADILNQAGVQKKYQKQYEDRAIRDFGNRREQSQSSSSSNRRGEFEIREPTIVATRRRRNAITIRKFWRYLRTDGNGWKLAVTASTWFLLDFTFYGLGFSSVQNMSKIWEGSLPLAAQSPPLWDTAYNANTTHYNATTPNIYTILIQDNVHSLLTSSISAIVGAILLIVAIEYWNRKSLQYIGFAVLTALFIIIGASYQSTINNFRGVTITLYALTQFCFYFGPNALTFIIAAELFPTRFRCTCFGISAAAGKLGSIIVQVVLAYSPLPGSCNGVRCSVNSPKSTWLGWILIIFAFPMLIGSAIAWKWLPELQERGESGRYENKSLEDLAERRREATRHEAASQTQRGV